MGDLVSQNSGQTGFVLGHGKDARIDSIFRPERKGILSVAVFNRGHLPIELLGNVGTFGRLRRVNNTRRDALHGVDLLRIRFAL